MTHLYLYIFGTLERKETDKNKKVKPISKRKRKKDRTNTN